MSIQSNPDFTTLSVSDDACCDDSCCGGSAKNQQAPVANIALEPTSTDIHTAVQERYGRLAEVSHSCCGDSCGCEDSNLLYEIDLSGVSSDVAEFSLGCGDPISIAELKAGEVVVDLGSGGGLDAFLAAKRVGETGKVIGVDMTPQMIQRATEARDKQGFTNVEFRLGQIEEMPIADNTADVIISNCVINLAPDKKAVFADAYRILKSGGRFAVADIVSDGDLTPEEQANMDFWSECMTGAIDMNDYLNLLQSVGFTNTEITHKVPYGTDKLSSRVYSARIVAQKP